MLEDHLIIHPHFLVHIFYPNSRPMHHIPDTSKWKSTLNNPGNPKPDISGKKRLASITKCVVLIQNIQPEPLYVYMTNFKHEMANILFFTDI